MFWENFQKLCESAGLKPTPLGNQLGIPSATIVKWKKGTIPNGTTLLKLAEYFNVSVDYLLGNEKATQTEQPLTSKQKEVLQLAKQLTDEDVRKLIDYAVLLKKADSQ